LFLRRIALAAQVIPPIATHFSVAWSVCLSHSCTLLKPFYGFMRHLWGPTTHCVGVPDHPAEVKIWGVEPPPLQPKHATVHCCCHLANRNEERFRLLPNHFNACSAWDRQDP